MVTRTFAWLASHGLSVVGGHAHRLVSENVPLLMAKSHGKWSWNSEAWQC